MGEKKLGKKSGVAETILERLEQLSAQVSAIEERTAATSESGIIAMLTEENAKLEKEVRFVSAQLESVCETLSKMMQKLSAQVEENGSKFDVDELSACLAAKIVIPERDGGECSGENARSIDYDALGEAVASRVSAYFSDRQSDCELISQKIIAALPVNEAISPDYIAAKVSEQIIVPPVDEGAIAQNVAEQLKDRLSTENLCAAISGLIDSDEIADCVAKHVGNVTPQQFEISVDDDGCNSLAKEIEARLDYNVLASSVAEKITPALSAVGAAAGVDAEELANTLADRLSAFAQINEDAIADKAAAIISNYIPETDTADIADKVLAGVLSQLQNAAPVDEEALASAIAARLAEAREEGDYDIVIDDDGLGRITERVSGEIAKDYGERYEKIDDEIAAVRAEYGVRFDKLDRDVEQIKSLLAGGAFAAAGNESLAADAQEEELVTVSSVIGPDMELDGSSFSEDVSDVAESDDVDFQSMMKYDRSFIARIIQGTDEQKRYYGTIKTALLSYKKVNSNVAWSSERFNKGRETIARFKIRGKTLCLYLALDPKDYAYSVYHQVDVSDNKSLRGTPMMVKVKSPLGVKKALRLVDELLKSRGGVKRNVEERDYAAMYPYETLEELIDDGLVKKVGKQVK